MESWVSIFVSAQLIRTILSIVISEPRFESHTGAKIREILAKWDSKLFGPNQKKERQDN